MQCLHRSSGVMHVLGGSYSIHLGHEQVCVSQGSELSKVMPYHNQEKEVPALLGRLLELMNGAGSRSTVTHSFMAKCPQQISLFEHQRVYAYFHKLRWFSLLLLGYGTVRHVTVQNTRVNQAQEKMTPSSDAVSTKCVQLLPAQHGILFYSKLICRKSILSSYDIAYSTQK